MCYRPIMRFPLLCHHFCVSLIFASDFHQRDWLGYQPFRPYWPLYHCSFPSKSQVCYPWILQCQWWSDLLIPAHPATITVGLIWLFQVCCWIYAEFTFSLIIGDVLYVGHNWAVHLFRTISSYGRCSIPLCNPLTLPFIDRLNYPRHLVRRVLRFAAVQS